MNTRAAQADAVAKGVQMMEQINNKVKQTPLAKRQKLEAEDRQAPGNLWVSRVRWNVDTESSLKQAVIDTWNHLDYDSAQCYPFDNATTLTGEWVGARRGFSAKDVSPQVPAGLSYRHLIGEVKSPLTILYLHGGSFVSGSPVQARPIPGILATATGGRAFTPAYRLAPQHPLPTFVLDVLTAYFYLISPPPEALHVPIPPETIVIAGESSGANLAVAIIQCLLQIRRQNPTNPTININGRTITASLPAGITILSGGFDFGNCLPSNIKYFEKDWIWGIEPWIRPTFPADEIWPSNPPRLWPYSHESALDHPFLNPCTTAIEHLRGFPAIWVACGEESLSDGVKVFAQHAAIAGAKVQFTLWEGMPHVFPLILRGLPQTKACMAQWAAACSKMVVAKDKWQSKGAFIEMGELKERELDLRQLTPLKLQDVRTYMYLTKAKLSGLTWTGQKKGVAFFPKPAKL